jgi:hypothetical protein
MFLSLSESPVTHQEDEDAYSTCVTGGLDGPRYGKCLVRGSCWDLRILLLPLPSWLIHSLGWLEEGVFLEASR